MSEQMYKESDVMSACKLVAMGSAGFASPSYVKEHLEKLPKSLQNMVISCTVAAIETRKFKENPIAGLASILSIISRAEKAKQATQEKPQEDSEEELDNEELPKELKEALNKLLKL